MAKRKITLLYGEKTIQVNYRIPESKKDEIQLKFEAILKGYENPTKVEIDVLNPFKSKEHPLKQGNNDIASQKPQSIEEAVPSWKEKIAMKNAEKKIDPADIKFDNTSAESYDGEKVKSLLSDEAGQFVSPDVKKDKVKILQEMANTIASGKSVKSELFTSKKKPIEDEYDFEYVTSLPDADSQVPIGAKGMAFYDRYDLGRFYVRYDGKYLRFENEKEFNRFAKDNNIK